MGRREKDIDRDEEEEEEQEQEEKWLEQVQKSKTTFTTHLSCLD